MKFGTFSSMPALYLTICGTWLLLGAGPSPAQTPDPAPAPPDPNWPCQQIKIEHMSLATMWSGPPVEPYANDWERYPAAAQLAQRLAQRRVPVKQATPRSISFSKAGDQQQTELLALMGGLFTLLDHERFAVIEGFWTFNW